MGLAIYASTCECAPPIAGQAVNFRKCVAIDFGTARAVHFESNDKREPSLTLRVSLNKSWPKLIRNTLVVSGLPTASV